MKQNRDPDPSNHQGASGYLYHKQRPEPRRRRPPPTGPARGSSRKPESTNLAKETFRANIKTFAVGLVCMLIVLFLAVFISRKTWEMRQSRATEQVLQPDPSRRSTGSTGYRRPGRDAYLEEEPDRQPRAQHQTELNTESMRKAVFLSKRAQALAETGKLEQAIERYREALNIWPYLTEGWANLGQLYLESNDPGRAQLALERAAENSPGSPEILNDLAVAHLLQNNLADALDLLDAAQEINPSYAPLYFNKALCHLGENDRESAVRAIDHYLRLRPRDPKALKERAYLYAEEGQYEEAMQTLKRALSVAPDWPPLYFDAAATAALLGRIDDALEYLEKSEVLTSPGHVYQIYQQPAFREIRLTELGEMFEQNLAERARSILAEQTEGRPATNVLSQPVTTPLSSDDEPL